MYNIDYKELGKRIRAERRRQDLTQEKLAEMADISDSFMGHIERGGRTLSIETLAKLANALNMNIEYIICGEFNYQPDMLPAEMLKESAPRGRQSGDWYERIFPKLDTILDEMERVFTSSRANGMIDVDVAISAVTRFRGELDKKKDENEFMRLGAAYCAMLFVLNRDWA